MPFSAQEGRQKCLTLPFFPNLEWSTHLPQVGLFEMIMSHHREWLMCRAQEAPQMDF